MYSDSTFLYTIYTHFIHILYFFFTLPPTTNIYTLSLHDALPISRAFLEIENVISVDISWKPIAPVDILAVAFKVRELLIADFRNRLPLNFDNLQVPVVNPDASFKIALAFNELLRLDVEDIAIKLIY